MQSDKGSISLAFTFRTRAENHHINKACSLLLPRLISVQTEHCFRTPALLYNRYAAPAKRPTKGGLLPSRVPWRGRGVPPHRGEREREGEVREERKRPFLRRSLSLSLQRWDTWPSISQILQRWVMPLRVWSQLLGFLGVSPGRIRPRGRYRERERKESLSNPGSLRGFLWRCTTPPPCKPIHLCRGLLYITTV